MILNRADLDFLNARLSSVSTTPGLATPAESVDTEHFDDMNIPISVPHEGGTFIITCTGRTKALTLIDGEIKLAPLDGYGSVIWQCEEKDGWLGFKNPISAKYLGYNDKNQICCTQGWHKGHEYFVAQLMPNGRYTLKQPTRGSKWKLVTVGSTEDESRLATGCTPLFFEFHGVDGTDGGQWSRKAIRSE